MEIFEIQLLFYENNNTNPNIGQKMTLILAKIQS